MTDSCIVVVDEKRARFFTLERPHLTEILQESHLLERAELLDPHGACSNTDQHGKPDRHADQKRNDLHNAFINLVAKLACELTKCNHVHHLVFIASPDILASLHKQAALCLPSNVQRVDFEEESNLSSLPEIRAALIRQDALPKRDSAPVSMSPQ